MARKLPGRFLPNDGESFCQECDKVRKLCRNCERCYEHCHCADECELCGGYILGTGEPPWNGEFCTCLNCVICGRKIDADHADYGYGLTEEQAEDNYGTEATACCETCVASRRKPPSFVERRLRREAR